MTRPTFALSAVFILIAATGCEEEKPAPAPTVTPAPAAVDPEEANIILPSDLRRQLKVDTSARFRRVGNDIVGAELPASGVESIEPLRGLPLTYLDIGFNKVSDLSPLEGMPLQQLILEQCPVDDISVLKGMPLEVLYLQDTGVTDLSMLTGMPLTQLNLKGVAIDDISIAKDFPLEILWVPGTKVSDISALAGSEMISLDIEGTSVSDISGLSTFPNLQRLNIAQTQVSDVTPLKDLNLTRITLTPERIKTGMEYLRNMKSLGEIRISMEGDSQAAGEFWRKYDAGVWDEPEEKPASETEQPPADKTPQP